MCIFKVLSYNGCEYEDRGANGACNAFWASRVWILGQIVLHEIDS